MKIKGNGRSRQVWINGEFLSPFPSQQVVNHSPDGFNWGFRGSGPAQLALAILLKICPKEKALREYQKFKDVIIAALPVDEDFEIELDEAKLS
jgi:hypothetical protein